MSVVAPLQNAAVKPQPSGSLVHGALLLQRQCACGSPTSSLTGKCEECKGKKDLQAKLTIGASNDPLEQEADRVADQVLAMPTQPAIGGAPPRIQRFSGQLSGQMDTVPASVDRVLASPGRPLEPALRKDMEHRFGHDFSRVRVHTGGSAEKSARDVNANAYTVGQNIIFGVGRFAPGTHDGRRLIAHELTHVAQQSGSDKVRVGENNRKRNLSLITSSELGTANILNERVIESASQRNLSEVIELSSANESPKSSPATVIRRQLNLPGPAPSQGQLNLSIDERGRVDVTAAGPANTPIVSQPTIGIRRDANGSYHILVGGKDKVVTLDQIPAMLRGALGGQSGGAVTKQRFRVPTCDQLRRWGGKERVRFMTFSEYQTHQKLWHSKVSGDPWLDLTPSLFDALLDYCMSQLIEIERSPAPEKPPLQDAPQRILPEGMEYA